MTKKKLITPLNVLLLLTALHSLILGLSFLLFSRWMLEFFDWSGPYSLFFPSQSGVFLMLLAVIYLWAVFRKELVIFVIISKFAALLFLLVHSIFFNAPHIIFLAGLADGFMGVLILLLLVFETDH